MYHEGRGVPQSDKEAVKWYQKAAEQGYADAQFNLGVMYKIGRGVPQSDKEAVKWYQQAADQGDVDALKFLTGLSLKQNDKKTACISSANGCENCGISAINLRACSRCKAVSYCSRECQVAHWKAGHKAACGAS